MMDDILEARDPEPKTSTSGVGADAAPEETKLKYLTVEPDEKFYRLFDDDPAAASLSLREDFKYLRLRDNDGKISLTRKFCAMVKYVLDDGYNGLRMLVRFDYMNFIAGIVTTDMIWNDLKWAKDMDDDDCDEFWHDNINISMLYMAMRLYTLSLYALDMMLQRTLTEDEEGPLKFNRPQAFRNATVLWGVLWRTRSSMPDPRVYRHEVVSPDITKPALLPCVVADCLSIFRQLLDHTLGGPDEAFLSPEDVDKDGASVNLLYWVYCTGVKDFMRAETLLIKLHHDIMVLSLIPTVFDVWFNNATADTPTPGASIKTDIAIGLGRNLLYRDTIWEHSDTVLTLLFNLSARADMQRLFKASWGTTAHPVYWIMKFVQRQLGMRAGEHTDKLLAQAMRTAQRWCSAHRVAMIEALHQLGIPLIPYLAPLVVICALPSAQQPQIDAVRKIITLSEDWLKTERRNAVRTGGSVPYAEDDIVRRTWITTLTKLRDNSSTQAVLMISLWQRLGNALGFSEQAVRRWLSEDDHWKKVPASELPWEHCAWQGCICYEQRPMYRLTACKGCWKVYYCGKSCQEL